MIFVAVFAASLCVFGVGMWIGWAIRGDTYWSGYRAGLHALEWVYGEEVT